jgi:Protein of unknown function (DUF3306)
MTDGFLGRWSQRKQAVRAGKALAEPAPPVVTPEPVVGSSLAPGAALPGVAQSQRATATAADTEPLQQAAPLSLDDVKSLTAESNFAPFAARGVAPEVRNAAMKKLFTDPHYNVMDRLDIYIDDYSQPDPLPESMLRQMASAKFLKLFEDQGESAKKDKAGTPDPVAQSAQSPQSGTDPVTENQPREPGIDHDNTDLRLQPNDAAGRPQPGRVPE